MKLKAQKMSQPQETWIINGTLVTQNDAREVRKAHLQIKEGKIAAIVDEVPSLPPDVHCINAQEKFILPGFIQPHIHLCQTLFRNMADDLELLDWLSQRIWPFEASHDYETLYHSAMLGIHELLVSGTTCILDMGTVHHTDAIYQAVLDSGLRANVGKCLMDHPETSPPYLYETTEAALTEAKALFDTWHGQANDRIRVSYAPRFAVSCTDALFQEVAKLSEAQQAIIHTHSSENQKEVEFVRELTGLENAHYLHKMGLMSERLVLAHCVWLQDDEVNKIKATGTHITHCPCSNMKLASGFAKVPELLDKGINVALASDGAPCNNTLDMFSEMRLAGLIHKPARGPRTLPATEILDMATRRGAQALGWFDKIGSIEVGKQADLIGLNLNEVSNCLPAGKPTLEALASSIVYASGPQHVEWTLVDGELVAQHGKALKVPHGLLLAENIRASQAKILERKAKLLAQTESQN